MGQTVQFGEGYYAQRANDFAPWLIRNAEHRVVGHYTVKTGVSWGMVMSAADKEWLAAAIGEKLG